MIYPLNNIKMKDLVDNSTSHNTHEQMLIVYTIVLKFVHLIEEFVETLLLCGKHVHEKQSERHFTFKLCMIFITSYLVKFQKILRGGGALPIHSTIIFVLGSNAY
jgi:hypothetical protein